MSYKIEKNGWVYIHIEGTPKERGRQHGKHVGKQLEEFIKVDATPCPNCFKPTLLRNESEASCEACGQGFDYVKGALRFK